MFTSSRTSAQWFWVNQLASNTLASVQEHPELVDARHDLGLTILFNHIRDGNHTSLMRQLKSDPRCVLLSDCFGATPLHWAARFGNVEALAALLATGANINATCLLGESVLLWAINSGSVRSCKAVLDAGVDVHLQDIYGNDAFSYCVSKSVRHEILELVLKPGPDLHARNKHGRTALTKAVAYASPTVCGIMLDAGADIESRDNQGWTPLCHAIYRNRHHNIQLLIDRGAFLDVLIYNGGSIVGFAAVWGDVETMAILQEACIEGLYLGRDMVKLYWTWFNGRDHTFLGQRAPLEDEQIAFEALLRSIIRCPDPPPAPTPPIARVLTMPGAFPSNPMNNADSTDYNNMEREVGEDEPVE
jgi:ankyrin repeat protein